MRNGKKLTDTTSSPRRSSLNLDSMRKIFPVLLMGVVSFSTCGIGSIKVKPELNNFVQSGMLEKDQFDSLDDSIGSQIILDSQTGSNSKRKDAQRLESLATSFAAYVNDRRLEVERVASSTTMKMQEKGSFLSMLSGIRRQLSDIDRDLSAAKGASIERLKEDQEVLLHERQSLINKLPSYD